MLLPWDGQEAKERVNHKGTEKGSPKLLGSSVEFQFVHTGTWRVTLLLFLVLPGTFSRRCVGASKDPFLGLKESPTTSKAGLRIFRGPVYTVQKSPLPTPGRVPSEWRPKPQLEASITKPCVSFLIYTRGI